MGDRTAALACPVRCVAEAASALMSVQRTETLDGPSSVEMKADTHPLPELKGAERFSTTIHLREHAHSPNLNAEGRSLGAQQGLVSVECIE